MTRHATSDRKQQIIAAALDDVIDVGVHRATHRSIATRAGVPLGSLTYYFSGLDDIFEQAFAHMVSTMSAGYRSRLEDACTSREAVDAVVDLICGSYMDERQMRALFEMYSFGSRNDRVRDLCGEWMRLSRDALTLHFSDGTARALDALIEGWPMHRYFERRALDRADVERVVRAVAG